MPKIVRIIGRFNLGGPVYNVAYLTRHLSPEFETLLIGGSIDNTEDDSDHILKELNLEPVIIPELKREISVKSDIIAFKKIQKIIKKFKPDIIHTHASKAGFIGRLAALKCQVPVIVHTFHGHIFHSYFNSLKSNTFKNIERYLAAKSNKIIAISENQKYELTEVYRIAPVEKVEVIPLGFDLLKFHQDKENKRAMFRNQYKIDSDEIAVGIVGRLVPVKNHEFFLKAIKYVTERTDQKVRAFIIGDGESRTMLENKAKEMGLFFNNKGQINGKSILTFTSSIKEIDCAYAGLDIVALTSLNEGTPVSLIEAQAANKPIVSTNVGGIENIVIPNVTALLSNNGNIKDFAEKLLILINNKNFRIKLSEKGWIHVKDKFHYSMLINNTRQLYHEILNS